MSGAVRANERDEYANVEACRECGLPMPACNRIAALSMAIESLLLERENAKSDALETLLGYGRVRPIVAAIIERRLRESGVELDDKMLLALASTEER